MTQVAGQVMTYNMSHVMTLFTIRIEVIHDATIHDKDTERPKYMTVRCQKNQGSGSDSNYESASDLKLWTNLKHKERTKLRIS